MNKHIDTYLIHILNVTPLICERGGWGPLDNGPRTSQQIIPDPSHVITDPDFRLQDHTPGWTMRVCKLTAMDISYLPDEDDTIKSRIVRYHFS